MLRRPSPPARSPLRSTWKRFTRRFLSSPTLRMITWSRLLLPKISGWDKERPRLPLHRPPTGPWSPRPDRAAAAAREAPAVRPAALGVLRCGRDRIRRPLPPGCACARRPRSHPAVLCFHVQRLPSASCVLSPAPCCVSDGRMGLTAFPQSSRELPSHLRYAHNPSTQNLA